MALSGWILDKSAAGRADDDTVRAEIKRLTGGRPFLCPTGQLEARYSARSASHYDEMVDDHTTRFHLVPAPPDILERALRLQRALAHHHGMWHRIPIPDLVIAETAAHHGLGVLHVDGDFERIAEVNGITVRRLTG